MQYFWNKLPKPFSVLAPMDDVTDNVFRQIICEIARPDVFFTEFTNSDGLNSIGNIIVERKLMFDKSQHPIVAQIWGNNPESMERASAIILKKGFDGIDINMGCPVADVVKKGSGAGMIGNYKNVEDVIKAVKNGVKNKIPVSVKTRLGLKENISTQWATFLLKQDLSALTIHGRTARQMSKGNADWDEIGKVVKLRDDINPNTVIIGNGDVKSNEEILEKHQKFGVDGVMVGRGIFLDPYVFSKSKVNHTKNDYLKLLIRHMDLFQNTWGEKKNFAVMKKFFKMYVNNFPYASELRIKLMDTKNYAEARSILNKVIKD